jgi:DNA end-binding protein Ku
MARTIWTGSLSFGLVTIPVGLYPATSDKSIHFNQFEEGTSDRIRYKKVNERTGEEVESSHIVRGVDVGGGEYVILTDEELAAAEPERSRAIEITDFVDLTSIDPVYYRTTYYLAPQGDAAAKAYALLVEAMQDAGKVAIATLVMRNKEYLVTIRPQPGVLALETMYFADEVRRPSDQMPDITDTGKTDARQIDLAKMLIDAMAGEWEPGRYRDTHRDRVQELVEQKREGKEIVIQAEAPTAKVVDLMEALMASVAASGSAAGGAKAGTADEAPVAAARTARPSKRSGGRGSGTGASGSAAATRPAAKSRGSKPAAAAPDAKPASAAKRSRSRTAASAAPAADGAKSPAKRAAGTRLKKVS